MSKVKQVRRTWTREEKLSIISEIGVDGASVLDISRQHNIDRYLLRRWLKHFSSAESADIERQSVFVPVVVAAPDPAPVHPVCIEVGLSTGRSLRLSSDLSDTQIQRFIVLVETA
ncbi:transposase [Pseudovibrio sp. Tun.PSC04-5.I4]|uniref:transposase n=1 Tax=Pseudovibrio sp. Tun.PSC04-5.I4 TaxID=1798213 RepID=UPI00088B7E53|nr:transposase [Pseudovibrio sp. Tun.PSC04-5.I4]SDR02512.1 Transposase [Pseudovibrio sp. Tun.PSC04-5.I4]SDR49408.1 Transposase [Pseudovibrio sp. Tun.PSC04-5.I4]